MRREERAGGLEKTCGSFMRVPWEAEREGLRELEQWWPVFLYVGVCLVPRTMVTGPNSLGVLFRSLYGRQGYNQENIRAAAEPCWPGGLWERGMKGRVRLEERDMDREKETGIERERQRRRERKEQAVRENA